MTELSTKENRLLRLAEHLYQVSDYIPPQPSTKIRMINIANGSYDVINTSFWPWLFQDMEELFPEYWELLFEKDYPTLINGEENGNLMGDLIDFFELDLDEALHLFCKGQQKREIYSGFILEDTFDARTYAKHIEEFVDANSQLKI